jgi:hypothetical protein
LLMEAVADGGSSDGIFAVAVNTNDGMVMAASITAGQLKMTTAIATATIIQRRHCHQCHCVFAPPSHRRLRQQQPPLKKITITVASINHRFCR